MKLNPNGPNYVLLKSIEDEMNNYEILHDGTIRNIINNMNKTHNEYQENKYKTNNEDYEDNNDNYNSGLSIGAIIGIIIGIVSFIVITIIIIKFVRKNKIISEEELYFLY